MSKFLYYLKICGIIALATLLLALADSPLHPIFCFALAVLYVIGIRLLWISILQSERGNTKTVRRNIKTNKPMETKRAA